MLSDRLVISNAEMRQGTKPWFAWRRGVDATATEAAALLRLWAPWDDAPQSWEEKRHPPERPPFRGNEATRHGNKMEPIARKMFNEQLGGERFEAVCVEGSIPDQMRDVKYAWTLGASLDGWSNQADPEAWVEIKCPFKGRESSVWRHAEESSVDPIYLPQLAFQACLMPDDAQCFFAVYCSPIYNRYTGEQEQTEDIQILDVPRDVLEPYMTQLKRLIPMYMRGDPEPSADDVPLLNATDG